MGPTPTRSTMNRKPVLWRDAKTVLSLHADEFGHKRLCDGITLNLGDACALSQCTSSPGNPPLGPAPPTQC